MGAESNIGSGVYRIVNRRNGKFYVGSSKNLERREKDHFKHLRRGKHHNPHLQRAWDAEPDKGVFAFQVFIRCSEEALLGLEQGCMDFMHPHYNVLPLAGRTTGLQLSESTKQVLREKRLHQKNVNFSAMVAANKGRPKSEAHKKATGDANRGKVRNEEVRQKLSAARKGKPSWNKGLTLTSDHRHKLSLAKKGDPTVCLSWYNTSIRHQKYWGA